MKVILTEEEYNSLKRKAGLCSTELPSVPCPKCGNNTTYAGLGIYFCHKCEMEF